MRKIWRLPALFGLVLAVGTALPDVAAAQLSVGVHGVRARDLFAGADGAGIRLGLDSALPVRVVANADFFFPDCDGRCRYQAAHLDLHVPLSLIPVLQPYALGGYSWRRIEPPGVLGAVTEKGFGVGLGARLGGAGMGLYLEARYEFLGYERQWVTRLGVEF